MQFAKSTPSKKRPVLSTLNGAYCGAHASSDSDWAQNKRTDSTMSDPSRHHNGVDWVASPPPTAATSDQTAPRPFAVSMHPSPAPSARVPARADSNDEGRAGVGCASTPFGATRVIRERSRRRCACRLRDAPLERGAVFPRWRFAFRVDPRARSQLRRRGSISPLSLATPPSTLAAVPTSCPTASGAEGCIGRVGPCRTRCGTSVRTEQPGIAVAPSRTTTFNRTKILSSSQPQCMWKRAPRTHTCAKVGASGPRCQTSLGTRPRAHCSCKSTTRA